MVKTSNIYCRYLTTAYKNLDNINQSAIVATRFGFKTCDNRRFLVESLSPNEFKTLGVHSLDALELAAAYTEQKTSIFSL